MKKVIVAIDSFKGCLASGEANQAAAAGVRSVYPDAEIRQVTVSDGGEGFMEAFHAAIGGELVTLTVRDPLMRLVSARYLLKDQTAVVEMAEASGLTLLTREERNPMVATSYGTGQLVADAVKRGARHIIVGLGGSATSDAGKGMLKALIDIFNPNGGWDGIEAMVIQLDKQAQRFAEISARHFGYDRSTMKGAGAAGGLGYAFLQYLDADCKPGIELLLETIRFDELVAGADLVITGEGSADRQTLMGKLPMGILDRQTLMGKLPMGILQHSGDAPVCLVAGRISDRDQLLQAGFTYVECINPPGIALEEAMKKEVAQENISRTIRSVIQIL